MRRPAVSRRFAWALAASVSMLLVLPPAAAGVCPNDRFEIHGIVIDTVGRPLEGARVLLLVDRISEAKFIKEGFRARTVTTGPDGQFATVIDCAAARASSAAPNPCAKNPKHVTVAADHTGFMLKIRVFKLEDLEILNLGEGCAVALPQVKLTPGF